MKPCCGCKKECALNCKCLNKEHPGCTKDCKLASKGRCQMQEKNKDYVEQIIQKRREKEKKTSTVRDILLDLANPAAEVASRVALENNPTIRFVPEGPARVWLREEYTFWWKQASSGALTEVERKRALQVISVIPFLVLQKAKRGGESDRAGGVEAVNRRIVMWKEGMITELMKEASSMATRGLEKRLANAGMPPDGK
jgi:hypothetical protein